MFPKPKAIEFNAECEWCWDANGYCRRIVHFNDRFIGLSFKTLGLGIVGTPPHVKPVHCSMLFLHDQVLFSHSDNMIRMSEILSNKTVRQSNIFLEFSNCYL